MGILARHWNGQTEDHPSVRGALLSTFSTGFRNALDASAGVFVPFPDGPLDTRGAVLPKDRGWLYDSLSYQGFAPRFGDGRASYVNNNRFDWEKYNANLRAGLKGTKPLLIDSLDFEYTKQPVLAAHVEGVLQPDGRTIIYTDAYGPGVHRKIFMGNQRFSDAIYCPLNPGVEIDVTFDINTRGKGARGFDWYGVDSVDGKHRRWNRTNPLSFVGPLELRLLNSTDPLDLAGKTTYIRPDFVQLAGGGRWPVPMLLTGNGTSQQRRLRKVVPLSVLNQASFPVEIGTTDSFFSGAGDGHVRAASTASWSTTRNDTNGEFASATSTSINTRANLTGGVYNILRDFWPFDTSSIPDIATVVAGTFSLYVTSITNDDSSSMVIIGPTTQASFTDVVNGDYTKCGSLNNPSEVASRATLASLTASAYNNFALTSMGVVSLTSYTPIGTRNSRDVDNVASTGTNDVGASTSEQIGTSQDPTLSVTYTVPSAIWSNMTGGMQELSGGMRG